MTALAAADERLSVARVRSEQLQSAEPGVIAGFASPSEQTLLNTLISRQVVAREEVIKALDSGAFGRSTGFSSFMVGFARQARPDLWLTGFRIAAGGDEIEIRGRMLDPTGLPDYVQKLNAVPVFQGRRFAALEMRRVSPDDASSAQMEQTPAVVAAGKRVTDGDQAQQQRPFVEFLLRSDSVGGSDAPDRAKGAS